MAESRREPPCAAPRTAVLLFGGQSSEALYSIAMELADQRCVPCRGGVPPLAGDQLTELGDRLGDAWTIEGGHHLVRTFAFDDFLGALAFTNLVGALAEEQGHHPDLHLAWGRVVVEIWTHKVDGLTESDFVLAAKIDRLAAAD